MLLLVLEIGNLLTLYLASLDRNRLLVHATPFAIIACMHLASIANLAFSAEQSPPDLLWYLVTFPSPR